MAPIEDEEELLRSVALQNARSILQARQRAEEELVRAKEALELKTRELARSLAMMRATLESTTDGILVTDGEGRVTGLNQKYVEMWRLPPEVITTQEHRVVLDACGRQFADPRPFLTRIEDIDSSSPPESYDLLELADGRVFERFSRIQFVEERNVGRVWSFRDITERRRAEAERERLLRDVRESEERLRLAVDAGQLGVWDWDIASGRITLSDQVAAFFGWGPGEFDGTVEMVVRHVDPDDVDRVKEAVRASVEQDAPYLIEFRIVQKCGAVRWIFSAGRVLRDTAGRPVRMLGVTTDLTDRKRTEEALKDADRKKDDFLALLAHELRNPLAPLRNGLEVIRLAGGDADLVAQARSMMARQLGHMVRLIDDLLDVSRIGRNKMELRRSRVLLADVIDNAVETARPAIDAAGHELHISYPVGPLFLDADLTRLAQVVSNLLTNSARYTERGGQIWLTAGRSGDEVVISVRDTGIGIPADALPLVFDMFSQVDRRMERSTGGLGIGLALVKSLVEMHGGTVTAESGGPGTGSTFSVRLPAAAKIPDPVSAAPLQDARPAGSGRRILVVDDSRDSARTLAKVLKLLGNEVLTAYDGLEAVEAAEMFHPEVILMDVGMPRLNGYEAARRIREQPWGRGIIIVALTGWGQESDRIESNQAGCDGHLVKPVHLPDLEKLLTELTAGTKGENGPRRPHA